MNPRINWTVVSCSLHQWQTESKALTPVTCYQNPTSNKLQRRLIVKNYMVNLQISNTFKVAVIWNKQK